MYHEWAIWQSGDRRCQSPITRSRDRAIAYSEVVADPDREPRLAPVGGAAHAAVARVERPAGEHDVLPPVVEQRPPRPVEVDREAERERFQPEAVGGAAVLEAEA